MDGAKDEVRCRVALTPHDRSGKRLEKEVEDRVRVTDPVAVERATGP